MEPDAARHLILARARQKGMVPDIHEQNAAYLARTHAAYRMLAARYGWVCIPSSQNGCPLPIEEIHERLYEAVRLLL